MIAEIGRRFRALSRAQRLRWAAVAPLGLATALLEGFGGAVVFALLGAIVDPDAAPEGRISAALQFLVPPRPGASPVLTLAAWAAGIHILKNLLLAVSLWWQARMAAFDTAALSTRLLNGYLQAPWAFHLRRSSAEAVERLRESTRPFFNVFESAAIIATEVAVVTALGVVAVAVAPLQVTALLAAVAVVLALVLRVAHEAQVRGGARAAEVSTSLYRHVQHSLGAAKEAIILGRRGFFVEAYARDAHAAARLESRRAMLDAAPRLIVETSFVIGMLALVAAASANGPAESVLPIVSLYAYAGFRAVPSAHRISLQMNSLRWSLGASRMLLEDLTTLDATPPAAPPPRRLEFRERLHAQEVWFSYDGTHTPVLRGIDLVVRRGESIALVGATGSGKSTLVDVLTGLLVPTSGDVTVDGQPIAARAAEWQMNIGYVPQAPFLLDDSIRHNIALGIPHARIDETALTRAVTLARLDQFVAGLPQGLDTVVGEHGIRLSGGERQRIAIARALYGDPALLVLDEATSSLDPGTEKLIAEAIEPLRSGGRTLIVIAHRMSTVERCDRVVLLDAGRVAAAGPYSELAERNPVFRAIAAL